MTIHTQVQEQNLVGQDARTVLTSYATQVMDAVYSTPPSDLVADLCEKDTTSALEYKRPVSLSPSRWGKVYNSVTLRRVSDLMLPVSVADYGGGVSEMLDRLMADEWLRHGWGNAPTVDAAEAMGIEEVALVEALENGSTEPSIENYLEGDTSSTTYKIFGQNKPIDPTGQFGGVWSNQFTSSGTAALGNSDAAAGINLADIDRVHAHIEGVSALNGRGQLGLEWVAAICKHKDKLLLQRYFHDLGKANDDVIEQSGSSTAGLAVPNRAKAKGIKVYSSTLITKANLSYYAVARFKRLPMIKPFLALTRVLNGMPQLVGSKPAPAGFPNLGIEWIVRDQNSEAYKSGLHINGVEVMKKGEVSIEGKRRVGVAIQMPYLVFEVLSV